MKYSHYFKEVGHLHHVDIYRVLDLFRVTDPCLQHAVKKLLLPGERGDKAKAGWTADRDVQEAIDSLLRWQEMQRENLQKPQPLKFPELPEA